MAAAFLGQITCEQTDHAILGQQQVFLGAADHARQNSRRVRNLWQRIRLIRIGIRFLSIVVEVVDLRLAHARLALHLTVGLIGCLIVEFVAIHELIVL